MGRLFWIVRWPNVITGSLYERDGGEAGGGAVREDVLEGVRSVLPRSSRRNQPC